MAVNLYKHNKAAYNSALEMLNTKGKAVAFIQPIQVNPLSVLNYVWIFPDKD